MPNPSKIHPKLARHLASERARAFGEPQLRIIVKYRSADALADTVSGLGSASYAYRFLAARAYGATAAAINALSERDDVEMVWFDEPVHTMLDVSVPLLEAPMVWQAGITGKGVKVAIVDTGIDPNHPDFANRIAQMKDFTGEGPGDNNGHGTHVAGIIGGSGAASNGKYKGVAPDCLFFTAKVLRGNGAGSTSDVMAGIEWAVQQGAQVVNLSLGSNGACDGSDALSTLCDAAVSRGIVMCIAAGNAGPDALV
jgi:subtilisin family serine protease